MRAVTRAVLTGLIDPSSYVPVESLDDCVSVQFLLGPVDGIGEESFQVSDPARNRARVDELP